MQQVSRRVTSTILSMSLLTVMAGAALHGAVFGDDDMAAPYKIGIGFCLLFLLQVWATRRFQSLPPPRES